MIVTSAGIIGGSFYIKQNRPDLMKQISTMIPGQKSLITSPLKKPSIHPTSQIQPTPTPQLFPLGLDQEYVLTANAFSFKIFNELLKSDQSKNIFISPSNIFSAISIIYQGALDPTKDSLEQTLEINEITKDNLNKNNQDFLNIVKSTDPRVEISVTNSIWGKKDVEFNQEFLATNQKYYQAKISTLDFTNPNAAATVNNWVKENTKGKITQIVNSPLPKNAVIYLINTVYFKGAWTKEFDSKLTKNQDFTLANKSKKKTPMMEQKGNFKYLENDLFQAVDLPYGKDGRFSMYVLLPKKDLKQVTSTMSAQSWSEWMDGFYEREGVIILPKFKVEYDKELKNSLTSLGMSSAFGKNANFDNIAKDLFISSVKHKAYIDVSEEGTETAGVTSVEAGITSTVPQDSFSMKVDKPFFFAIRDNRLETILFMGIINDPKTT